ncbi:beta-citrylglutamate synthase B [Tachysurus ichikawai]
MCSRVWFVTDRRISQEYPQVQILRALKERCVEDDVEFRYLLMDEIVITITDGQLEDLQRLEAIGQLSLKCQLGVSWLSHVAIWRIGRLFSLQFLLGWGAVAGGTGLKRVVRI